MLRLLCDDPSPATEACILSDWPSLLSDAVREYGESEEELKELFESLR